MDNLAADFEINPNNPLNTEYELSEGVGFDCSFELYASGTVWGSIDGDINNQTDLINLLNTKVDLTDFNELSTTVTNNYNELSDDISDLTTTVTDNYNTLSGQISDLTSTVNDNYTSLNNRLTTAEGSILDLTDTVNDNYTELNGKITTTNNNLSTLSQTVEDNNIAINNRVDGIVDSFDGDISDLGDRVTANSDNITTIQNTINSYGDIVTYNAAYFATANQGALADTALQPNDNISDLTNDVGYITSADLPANYVTTDTVQDITSRKTFNDVTYFKDTISSIKSTSETTQLMFRSGANGISFNIGISQQALLTQQLFNIVAPINATTPSQDETEQRRVTTIGYINSKLDNYVTLADLPTIEDLTTTAQLNALNSGATVTNIGQITTNQNNIADIRALIPVQATTSNQLADKNFVNSSISTNTAYFIGTFNSVAELEAYTGTLTNNDYAFVATTDTAGNTLYDRYKYNADTQQWIFEYELNNSSFTAQQWASINSGITSGDVTLIGTALQPNDNISELINDAGYITSASLPTVNNGTLDIQVNGTSIGTFTANQSGNTTANIVVPDSATWGNITGTLSNQIDLQNALNSKYDASNPDGYITSADLPTNYVTTDTAQDISGKKTFLGEKAIYFKQQATSNKLGFTLYNPSNVELGALEYRPNTISGSSLLNLNCPQTTGGYVGFRYWGTPTVNIVAPKVATAGNYFMATHITDGTNTVTASNTGTVNISTLLPDVSNFVTNSSLATTLADYALTADIPTKTSDLTNDSNFATVSQIPTVGNGTVTINQGGTQKGTFTLNQSGDATIDLDAGGSSDVFVAEYGVTTYAEITSAINSGKSVFCRYIKEVYENNVLTSTITYYATLQKETNSGYLFMGIDTLYYYEINVDTSSIWDFNDGRYQLSLGYTPATNTLSNVSGLTASIAELNYTDGVTSNIQTQLNDKVNTSDIWYDSSNHTLYIGVPQS